MRARIKMCEKYQGWTNRETWACNLWLDNDRGIYEDILPLIDEANEVSKLADSIQEYMENRLDLRNWNLITQDLISMVEDIGSLWRVNWREIAENKLSEKVSN